MTTHPSRAVFPFGAHLGRDPLPPMAEMKRDLETIARAGFTLVKLQVNWATTEPQSGRLDLARFEELIVHAARFDLDIYLGFVLEHAPHWLWRKHPDCRMVGRDGAPVAYEAVATLPADGKPGPCFDHVEAMADSLDYLRRATVILAGHPNLAYWNTWQEIGHWAEWIIGQPVCYCPATLTAFREWLATTFAGDLDALNRAWRTNHGDWRDVLPTRTQRGKDAHPVDMAWLAFMQGEHIARVLRARAAVLCAADPGRRPVFAHKGAIETGSGLDRQHAACQDFLGHSAYPAWSPFKDWDDKPAANGRLERHGALLAELWGGVVLQADHLRGANPSGRVWIAELQGGPVSPSIHQGRVPSPSDLRRWVLGGLAHGESGISFWVLRREVAAAELNGFGLLDSTGDTTDRFAEAGRLARALNRHADLLGQPSTPPAEAAILIDDANHRFQQTMTPLGEHQVYGVRGWHRLLFDLGVPVDFLFDQDFDTLAARYRVLILPFPLLLSDALAQRLAAWVAAGGTLISDCCPGRVDENAFATRGEISALAGKLFGVEQESFQLLREPGDVRRWTPAERTWGEFHDHCWLEGVGPLAGKHLRPALCLTTFQPRGSETVLTADGRCAGTLRRHGNGAAWLIGSLPGHAGLAHRHADHHAGIAALLAAAGIRPQMLGGCYLRKRIAGDREAWFLFNPSVEPVTVELPGPVEDLLDEPVTLQDAGVTLTVPGLNWRCLLRTTGEGSVCR